MTGLDLANLSLRESGGDCTIMVKVVPRAARDTILGVENGQLKLKIQAPPVEGAANEAVIGFLSEVLGKSKSHLEIVKGQKSRHKVIKVRGMGKAEILESLGKINIL